MNYTHLFGPVPSRRLGISLGIDLVPLKTCSFNCIYCECGKTTNLTVEQKEYVPTGEVIAELDFFLDHNPAPDFITFAGSGEPILHCGLGEIIRHIKEQYPEYRVALITNGCLFPEREVRREVLDADVIIPSLDTATDETFRRINHPHGSLQIGRIISGLEALREEFHNEIWLEIFIVPGLNDSPGELNALKSALGRIRPDRVHLNTLDRPGVVDWIRPATPAELGDIAHYLNYPGTEIVGRPASRTGTGYISGDIVQEILQTIRRRPCTMEDLRTIFPLHPHELEKYIRFLLDEGKIGEKREERGLFFVSAE